MSLFEKVNIPDCLVIIGLVTALIMAIFYNLNELAMSIASGLLGYIGGTVKSAANQMILQRRAHPLKKRPASSKKAGRKRWWDSSLPVMRPWRPFPIWTDGKEFKLIGSLSSRYAFTHVALELDFFKTGPFR